MQKLQVWDRRLACLAIGVPVAAAAVLLAPRATSAAEGYFLPAAEVESRYNDNWRLRPDGQEQISAIGTFLDLHAQFGLRSPRSDISIIPRLTSSFFADSEDDDRLSSDDQFLNLSAYREMEKARWAITAGYANESVLTAEISDVEFDDPTEDVGDTGIVNVRNDRERITARPTWLYNYSEQTQFGLGYSFVDVAYDDEILTRQTDFTDHEVDANLSRQLTERTLLTTRVFGSRFEADQIDNQTDSVGIDFEFNRRLTERMRGSFIVGAQRVEADYIDPVTGLPTSESKTNTLFGLGLRTDLTEATSWNATLSRDVNPNGTGFVVQNDQLLVAVDHAFGPRLRGRLGTRLLRSEGVGDNENIQFTDRDYARIEGGLRWALTETWSLIGGYSYTRQEFDRGIDEGDASSNAVSLAIAYQARSRFRGR